jgi:cathepsin L
MIETYASMSTTPYELTDLSPQQLVACAPNPDDCGGVGGCEGSVPELAFDYVRAHGLTTEWYIPYTAHGGGGCNGQPGQPGCPCLCERAAGPLHARTGR